MPRTRWILVCAMLFIIALPVGATPSRGINEVTRIEITNAALVACNFSPGLVQGHLSVVAYNVSNIVENPPGTPLQFTITFSSGANSEAFNLSLDSDDVLPYGILLSPTPITDATIAVTGGTGSDSVTYACDTGESSEPDSRLNPGAGDLINALYNGTDDAGQPIISVWEIQSDSSGSYVGSFAYATFEPYIDATPSENTLLDTVGKTRLYALMTGEFQLVVGPDIEGKTFTTVFTGLPAQGVYWPNP